MESIRAILIRTCMSQIQKELTHLEHWLIHLPDDTVTAASTVPVAPIPLSDNIPRQLNVFAEHLDTISKQMSAQQETLNHIIGRLSILESVKEVHIDDEPWQGDTPIPYVHNENEEDEEDTVIYVVHKSEHSHPSSPISSITVNVIHELAQGDVEEVVQEVIQEEPVQEVVQEVVQEPVQEVVQEVVQEEVVQEVVQEPVQEVVQEVVQEEVVQEVVQEEVVQEPVQEVVQEEVVQEIIPVEQNPVSEETEETEEEEEDIELEEVVYQGVTYYRDPEQFIYSTNDEGEVSDEPVGYWKVKSKTIAFYNKK